MRKVSITSRIISGAFITAILLLAFAGSLNASAISLKQNSVITDNTIKLGDVFHGLPRDEDKALGPAPRPGHDMVLNARTLLRIAVALDLPWRPSSNADYVVLRRAGTVVDADMMKTAIRDRLAADGMTGKYNVTFTSEVPEMVLPQDVESSAEVVAFSIKPEKNWFEATVAAPSKDNPVQSVRLTGTLQRMVDIPVLNEALAQGDIINEHDIHLIEVRESSLKDDMIIKSEDLVGMTPRRMITAGTPINTIDVESPRMVTRGDLVTLVFTDGSLLLTAQGKALQHGAKGDTIRVVNTSSNKTIQAEVTGTKEATVKDF